MPVDESARADAGLHFEEEVAAFFQAAGFFVERNILFSDVDAILEIDLVATGYSGAAPRYRIVEAKSGEWGFPDLFKLRGWMDYIRLDEGVFAVRRTKNNREIFERKARDLNITLFVMSGPVADPGFAPAPLAADVDAWRFSLSVERGLLRRLKRRKRGELRARRYAALDRYFHRVTSGIYSTPNILERVHRLNRAFQASSRLSARCGFEMTGGPFDGECRRVPRPVYADTYYQCRMTDIQISTFIEHRARLALLKNAVDYKLFKQAGDTARCRESLRCSGIEYPGVLLEFLPPAFKEGLDEIAAQPCFSRYPVFWQWFLWAFGGFLLKGREELEYGWLSQKSGIPAPEIPNALKAYDILFPRRDGWFVDLPGTSLRVLKMFSVPFYGAGAWYRNRLQAPAGGLMGLRLTGWGTYPTLRKWMGLAREAAGE